MIEKLKLVAGTLVLVGAVLGFLYLKYAPQELRLAASPKRPWWVPWLVWAVTSGSAVIYVVLDWIQRSG